MTYHNGPRCGGALRGGGRRGEHCTKPAGWGTGHPGAGRCKFHDTPQVSSAVRKLAPYLVQSVGDVSASQLEEIQELDKANLILARSRLIERMSLLNTPVRELESLSAIVTRFTKLIGDVVPEPTAQDEQDTHDEMQRLKDIERQLGGDTE